MLRTAIRSLIAGLATAALAAGAAAQDRVVNVYNWSDYIDEEVLTEFTEETGIRVVYDVYDNNDIVETKLLAGGSGYDVVVPTDSYVYRQINAGTLQKLDKSKLPNWVHMWQPILDGMAAYDPGNEYAVPYMWATTAFGYNIDKIKEIMPDAPVDSWTMVFDPEVVSKFTDCGVYLLDAAEDVIQSALRYLGLNPNSKDRADIEKAGELLQTIRPYIQKFHSSEYINALANGDICLAMGYSGDIIMARERAVEAENNVNIRYVIPEQGALMWFDSFVVPADAPHPDEAHAFINFMMKPEIAAKNSNYVYYANANKDSQPLLDEEVIDDKSIYPDDEIMSRLFTSTSYEPGIQRVITRLWTNLKAGG